MDKSWISKPRNTLEYAKGLESFLDFAFLNSSVNGRIKCPCSHCGFRKMETREVVYEHLLRRQFPSGYTLWLCHGEEPSVLAQVVNESERDVSHSQNEMVSENSIQDMIHEAFRNGHQRRCEEPSVLTQFVNEIEGDLPEGSHRQSDFDDLIWDSNEQLYEGCTKYSKLAFLIKLYHIKVLCRMTDKAMTMILELLQDAFEHAKIPKSFYEAKKVINKLGLNYEKIDACPNDCMLYWKEDETRESCKVCGKSRYKENGSNSQSGGNRKKKKSAKILRYFPLKPRLQRLFMSSKTAKDMRWHAVGNNSDSSMRHPRDSEAWKTFDRLHTDFSNDPRNVRLGLASDGFNPFGTMSTNYSIWPVVLMPYNLPPWMCMKPTSFILSMIIPGKKQPGNDIDIYLQPLIEELKELWNNGVATYDSSSSQVFTMRAALMWTISDFPGLGTLSGWNVYNGTACPCCNKDFKRHRLTHGGKFCFMGHRRFLERGHKFRLRRAQFDGDVELRDPPKLLSGLEILEQVKNIDVTLGKKPKSNTVGKRTRGKNVEESDSRQWRKKSVFFELPYWKFNLIRHNLDVMHIEKNVCDNVLYTLLNDASRTKDNLNARKDLLSLGIRRDLWPDEKGKYKPALYTLSNASKTQFLTILKNVTVPDGYSSNIASSIDLDQRKITGLKSHDSHILMEQLLPLAMRKVLPNQISAVLIDVCSFFKHLCGKVLVTSELEKLQERIVVTLCHLETIFPPSFFTVMVHLLVHLVEEVKCGGPVHYRWMYPIER